MFSPFLPVLILLVAYAILIFTFDVSLYILHIAIFSFAGGLAPVAIFFPPRFQNFGG